MKNKWVQNGHQPMTISLHQAPKRIALHQAPPFQFHRAKSQLSVISYIPKPVTICILGADHIFSLKYHLTNMSL